MDIIQTVHNLQQKPEPTRRRLLAGIVIVCMILITGLWLVIVSKRISQNTAQPYSLTAYDTLGESPFAILKNTFDESISELQNLLR